MNNFKQSWNSLTSIFGIVFILSLEAALAAQNCDRITALESFRIAGNSPDGSQCNTYLVQPSVTGISCVWEFTYRNIVAIALADSLWNTIGACRPGKPLEPDLRVNHPDSYQLRGWVSNNSLYRVSVKDKAGQRKTLVFLRFEK